MKLHVEVTHADGPPYAVIDDEPDPQRRDLLFDFMRDLDGSEDMVLADLDHAEAGAPALNGANNYVNARIYPDGRVVITQLDYLLEDEQMENPPQTVITIAEARKLILDWIDARDKWYAEREAQAAGQTESLAQGTEGGSGPVP